MTVAKLKNAISYRHFREQVEYDAQHPAWEIRFEYYFAQLTAAIYNVHIDPKKQQPYDTDDFLLVFKEKGPPERMSLLETRNAILDAFGYTADGDLSNPSGEDRSEIARVLSGSGEDKQILRHLESEI